MVRFLLGGAVVSLFAVTAETLKPKTFAGLFGAAPSVAIATLALAYCKQGGDHVAIEGRSMLIGSAALLVYSAACVAMTKRKEVPVWLGALLNWTAWAAVAFGCWAALHGAGITT